MAGCSHTAVIQHPEESNSEKPEYSLIFYIHGDGDYLYHTRRGKPVYADKNALNKARSAAVKAKSGEVIIFHRRPERSFLGIFPRRTSRMYVYQNGVKQIEIKYRENGGAGSFMNEEQALFQEFSLQNAGGTQQSHFFYFGHEIPYHPATGYHRSNPDQMWNTTLFSEEIKAFLPPGHDRFGIVGLSTCNNGTPEMAAQLKSVAKTLLASPQNLHLSHMDVDALSLLENSLQKRHDPAEVARRLAERTYSRLSNEVQTEITLSVYLLDSDELQVEKLIAAAEAYRLKNGPRKNSDNVDCADVLPVDFNLFSGEVFTFHRPPLFGIRTDADSHSGWGCKPKP